MSNIGLMDKGSDQLSARTSVVDTDRVAIYTSTGTEPELATIAQINSDASGGTIYLTAKMTDISTAGTIYIPSPVAGTIAKITSIIDGTTATADAVITGKIGAVAITGGVVTVASGSGAGDVDTATPTAANTVAVNSNINLTTDGASTNTVAAQFVIEITIA